MSRQPVFDRKKGFIALPVEILEIDLSPGAFRLLAELCRMANSDGFCWPSLAQLSERMGRSRASISGYVRELREAELVTTEEQKTANGYNYRLKYLVTFWKDWRGSLGGRTRTSPEHRVQPDERLKEDKNQNHKNHRAPAADQDFDNLLLGWNSVFRGAPYPSAAREPGTDLLVRTATAIRDTSAGPIISADIMGRLSQLWQTLAVKIPPEKLTEQARFLSELAPDQYELDTIATALIKLWERHWRRIPTPEQFATLVKKTGVVTTHQKRMLLCQHMKRWDMAQKTLRRPPMSACVSIKQKQPLNAVA